MAEDRANLKDLKERFLQGYLPYLMLWIVSSPFPAFTPVLSCLVSLYKKIAICAFSVSLFHFVVFS